MPFITHADVQPFIQAYGYWGVGLVVGIESMGIPLPGETVLVAAAIYAANSDGMLSTTTAPDV